MGKTSPGEADVKGRKKGNAWGSLPPKDRAGADNLINKKFPPHYARIIEAYTKSIADKKANSKK